MNYSKYERHLKDKLGDHDSNIDDQDMWAVIEPHLPQEKKRRILWIPLFIGFASFALAMFSFQSEEGEARSYGYEIEPRTLHESTEDNNKLAQSIVSNETEGRDKVLKSSNVSTRKATNNNNNPIINHQLSEPITSNISQIDNPESSEYAITRITPIQNPSDPEKPYNGNTEIQAQGNDLSNISTATSIEVSNDLIEPSTIKTHQGLLPLAAKSFLLKREQIKPTLWGYEFTNAYIPENRSGKWSLNVGLEYADLHQSYSSRSPEAEVLSNLRNTLESSFESLGVSAMLEYNLSPKISISSGIEIYRYQTSSINTSFFTQLENIPDTIAVFNRPTGTFTEISEQVIDIASSRRWLRYTTSTNLTIPVLFYHKTPINNSNFLKIGGGIRKGVLNRTRGYEQDLDFTEYNLEIDIDNRLRAAGQDHLVLSLHWESRLNKNSTLLVGLRYLHDVTGVYNSNFQIEKKLNHIGLQLVYSLPINL